MFRKTPVTACVARAVVAGASLFAAQALAQGTVEVTGSRIKRVDVEGAMPVQTVTREEIERRGVSTLNEVINNLTLVSQGSFGETQSAGNSFAPGTAGVSLRGLGTNATLVLVNGRRTSTYGFAQNLDESFVDLNSIPLAAVERIEILKDGASALYGSDALAGVINVILRKDYKGLEGSATVGSSRLGGAAERNIALTGGFGDLASDRFNVFGSLALYRRDSLMGNERDFSKNPDQSSRGGYDFRSPTGNPGTWLTGGRGGFTDNTVFPSCPPELKGVFSDGRQTCFYNFAKDNPLLPETERFSAFSRGSFAISSTLSAIVEVGLNKNTTYGSAAPTPGSATLPVGHVSNPYPFVVPIRYRYTEVGPRLNLIETDAKRVLGALQGENLGWSWELGVVNSKSSTRNTGTNYISQTALVAAIPQYNFADISKVSQSTIDGLRIVTTRVGESEVRSVDFKASRDLFKMDGGMAAIAIGGDSRKETLSDTPDENIRKSLVVGSGGTSSLGERKSDALFAELVLPIFKGFEGQIAVRRDNYSDFGSATVPKVAASYRVNPNFMVRGGVGRGFRAPSLVQLYLGQSFSFPSIRDVVRCDAYTAAEAAGKASVAEKNAACGAAQVRSELGGNPALDPEKSESKFLGVIFEPIRNLSLSLDYWRFDHTNKIDSLPSSYILRNSDALSASAGRPVVNRFDPSARDIAVGSPGALRGVGSDTGVGFFNSYFNAQAQQTSGVDIETRYRTTIEGLGRFGIQSVVTKMHSFKRQTTPDGEMQQLIGTYQYPRTRASTVFTLDRGTYNYTIVHNFVGRYDQYYQGPDLRVDSVSTFDAQVQYTGIKNVKLSFGGRNVFNKRPAFSDIDWYGYDSSNSDPRGAFWYLRGSYKF